MKLTIELGGSKRTVDLARVNGPVSFLIDGVPVEADAVEIATGLYSILIGGESFEVRVEPMQASLRVYVAGQEYSVTFHDPRRWRRKRGETPESQGRQQVLAPMPGKIARVLIKAGETIEAGQGLVVVEAMKMQNEVRSPKSGLIERILVSEGQSVNAGEVLAIVA
jgi:biotin carboxyl carrier protein